MSRFEPNALRRLLALLFVTIVLSAVTWKILRFETSILTFLPQGDQELFEVTNHLADSTLSKTMILSLSGNSEATPLAAKARDLAARLRKVEGVESVDVGPSEEHQKALFNALFKRRYEFAELDPARISSKYGTSQALDERATALLSSLSAPDGLLEKQWVGADPLGLFSAHLESLELQGEDGPQLREGQFFSKGGDALLFLHFRDSAFNSSAQNPLLKALEREQSSFRSGSEGLKLEFTGINKFAVESEKATKRDIERISIVSTSLLLAVYFWLFRRPSRLIFPLIPLGVGTVVGVLASQLVFGHVHVITLAFGSSLIGVAIDFPVHLIAHHDLSGSERSPEHALSEVLKSLLLAGGTTIVGLAALGFAGLPGLSEMAVFAASGVLGGLVSVAVASPLLGRSVAPSKSLVATANRLHGTLAFARRFPLIPRALAVLALTLAALGLSQARFERELEALNQPQHELKRVDRSLREKAGHDEDAKLVVTLAWNLEEALQELEQLERDAGSLPRHHNVLPWLRSSKLRSKNVEAFRSLKNLRTETLAALGRAGFAEEAFNEFQASLGSLEVVSSAEELAKELPSPLLSPLLVRLPGRIALLTEFAPNTDPNELKRILRTHPKTHYFSQKESLEELFVQVANRTALVMIFGFSAVFALVFARYRDLRKTLSALLAPSLSCVMTLGILALCGQSIGLLHILALLLVLSMGEDYGIFLVDAFSSESPEGERAALVSIALASFSTIVSFGLLALSGMPALRALGLTVAIGDFGSLILAPTSLLIFVKPKGTLV